MLPTFDSDRCIGCLQCVQVCPMGVLGKGEDNRPATLPRRRCIGCMHCAAVCPRQAVQFEGLTQAQLYQAPPENPVENLIRARRSVRRFKTQLPERTVIQWALDGAAYAPSGKNVHANRWSVLWGRSATDKVTEMVLDICRRTGEAPELPKLYGYGTNLITCNAPCVILGWSPDDCLNPVVDTAVAMTTVELLLQSAGLSTCWGGYLNQIANHNDELRRALGVPEGCHLRCALMVGYPDRETYRNIPYRPQAAVTWLEDSDL
ncbi:MAG: nitroreductase family protein [Oscillospiraceae bacterium]|nr:nitroreductase family protein [Oscillospiraceae bacterium]